MALTEIYVDPSIAADSGAGTIGDPYGDLEYAIEQETFDTTNGTRVNIKAGTSEILAAELGVALADTSVSVAWVPAETAPLIFEGYTAAAGDGGLGVLDGSGSIAAITQAAQDYTTFKNLHITNCGATTAITLDDQCSIIKCKFTNMTGSVVSLDDNAVIIGNYLSSVGGTNKVGLRGDAAAYIAYNYVDWDGTNGQAIISLNGTVFRNIVVLNTTSTCTGININQGSSASHNSVYNALAGTGAGIDIAANAYTLHLTNNIVEGFSGTGGVGFQFGAQTSVAVYGGNAVYDCDTEYESPSEYVLEEFGDNETLTASPFTSAATGDFNPVDTGNVKEGSLPQIIGGGLV